MPEWLVERGIGEDRAILVERGRVLAAKCRWPGELQAGQRFTAKLTCKNGPRGLGQLPDGREVWLDRLPRELSEGSSLDIAITRGAMAERGRLKLAAARPVEGAGERAPDIFTEDNHVHRFPAGLWEELWDEAWSGEIAFAGGSLLFAVTPAMTLVDVDGDLPPRDLALKAAPVLGSALERFDLGGSIGIDFPTIEAKDQRKLVDRALDTALVEYPHERTAMNGFGFVQIVARLEGPSLLHRMATSRVAAAARMALRRAEMVEGAGVTLLTVHPALKAKLKAEWLAELERRNGRPVRAEVDPALAIEGASAQIVPHA